MLGDQQRDTVIIVLISYAKMENLAMPIHLVELWWNIADQAAWKIVSYTDTYGDHTRDDCMMIDHISARMKRLQLWQDEGFEDFIDLI